MLHQHLPVSTELSIGPLPTIARRRRLCPQAAAYSPAPICSSSSHRLFPLLPAHARLCLGVPHCLPFAYPDLPSQSWTSHETCAASYSPTRHLWRETNAPFPACQRPCPTFTRPTMATVFVFARKGQHRLCLLCLGCNHPTFILIPISHRETWEQKDPPGKHPLLFSS